MYKDYEKSKVVLFQLFTDSITPTSSIDYTNTNSLNTTNNTTNKLKDKITATNMTDIHTDNQEIENFYLSSSLYTQTMLHTFKPFIDMLITTNPV